ncbi:putative acetyltransferase [Legionella geestiana]|uniref:Putative acetyltransferase n=1 Tax=Legionella geestiana TaxID=45065 RepID=A0A0W0U9D1_9GAMM|nr:GNAT family N-acetyltransferase [Legionella geestiana]KTD04399.1 putative acetyltransferase [Legionella geestiana]QBS12947.1 GNAT family N-acetyltransferase [Legionella geestiana]QDQ39370.1 GNAT family N-acetyltransferase [Legionella geestiana]STX54551.1 putative acetyltransferase [Legionella geestiana]
MSIRIRKAKYSDLPDIILLLADDEIGSKREKYDEPLPQAYYDAFDLIDKDSNNWLMIAELDDKIIGTLQLTFITYLTYQGGTRAQIEGVRTDRSFRGRGIGKALVEWAINKSKEKGCHLVQLTTDKRRPKALAFYTKSGFVASHEGLKLKIGENEVE